MLHAPRHPFDPALPLVARGDFELDDSKMRAGARVEARDRFHASALWSSLLVDCVPPGKAEPTPAPAAATLPARPPATKQPKRARAGA